MSENVIYNQGDVLVQPSVVIFGRQPYPTSSITAVRLEERESVSTKYRMFFNIIKMLLFFLFMVPFGKPMNATLWFSLVMLGGIYILYHNVFNESIINYTIILYFTNKSVKAYKSTKKQEVLNIVDAINQVIE